MRKAREMAVKWNCCNSTVVRWCASGIIPPAEQTGKTKTWMIPDDWPKPPMTRHGLCFLIDSICQTVNGANSQELKLGYSDEKAKEGYQYLVDAGFISNINPAKFRTELISARILPRGEELLRREAEDSNGKINYKVTLAAKANIGIASIEATGSVENE